MTEFSPFSCPIFLGHPEASGFCFQSERLLYRREPNGVRAEPGKQKTRSCRTQELARSSARENEWQKKAALPDWTKVGTTNGPRQHTRQEKTVANVRARICPLEEQQRSERGTVSHRWDWAISSAGDGHSTVGVARRKSQRQQTHYLAYRGFTGVAVLREPRNLRKLSLEITHRPKSV